MVKSNSLECQDLFIYHLLGNQKEGFFLDVGCQTPILANNTYLLETLGWKGLAFDKLDITHWDGKNVRWSEQRQTPKFLVDATTEEFTQILKDNVPANTVVDYISLDIDDNGGINFAIEGILRIINAGITFKALTLEHEAYRNAQSNGELVRGVTRIILGTLGYRLLYPDVCFDNGNNFEDWWVNPKYFPAKLAEYIRPSMYYKDCIETLKDFLKLENQ